MGVITVVLLLPVEFVAYKFFGPPGQPNSLHNKQPINWGKGDYWTPWEPYLCSGRHSQYHCSKSEYRKQTLIVAPLTLLYAPMAPALAASIVEQNGLDGLMGLISPYLLFATCWVLLFGLLNLFVDTSAGILKRMGFEDEA
jgi:hypothetical protein